MPLPSVVPLPICCFALSYRAKETPGKGFPSSSSLVSWMLPFFGVAFGVITVMLAST